MDKKPPVFANKIEKELTNNNNIYYSANREEKQPIIGENINQKINNIFNSSNYVYKADVKITLNNKTVNKKIVGKNNTHLITIENELIPINEIKDIYYSK